MNSVNDWAAKAARYIADDFNIPRKHEARMAATIATFAEPLMTLLQEARREHEHGLHGARCCPQCTCDSWPLDGEGVETDSEPMSNSDKPCDCGADAWNKRIDEALS